ncbi:MAG: NUDIX hydrolase [Polaromonas sp.]|nr:NUDIX hydrolase [Polaromonas sp.]
MKTTSHGILILNTAGELLLCHATGSRYWDIPKGGSAEGESGPQTAVRETLEECGLQLNPGDLRELGRFAYRPDKALLLYAVLLERLDTRLLSCSSQYQDQRGQMRPEMDAFRWTPFSEVPKRCAKSLSTVLTQSVSLPNLLKQLEAAGPAVKPAVADAPGPRQEPS